MAYLRGLSIRATRTYARAYNPSFFTYFDHDREESHNRTVTQQEVRNFIQQKTIGRSRFTSSFGTHGFFHGKNVPQFSLALGSAFVRHESTNVGGGVSCVIESVGDRATDVISDVTSQVVVNAFAAVNEIAISAADYFILFAPGINWWVFIMVPTLTAFPVFVTRRGLSKMLPLSTELEAKLQGIENKRMDSSAGYLNGLQKLLDIKQVNLPILWAQQSNKPVMQRLLIRACPRIQTQ